MIVHIITLVSTQKCHRKTGIHVIEELEKKISQCKVAEKFGISPTQVSPIWKTKQTPLFAHQSNLNPSRKRARESAYTDVEDALVQATGYSAGGNEMQLFLRGSTCGEKKDHNCEAAEHWITSVWTSIQDRYSASEIITVTKQAFIIISFQKAQCVSKMKNFSVERNQKNV
ncbi:unnamed protein product [Clavelina lepadiformis]|uniref:HTH psq-type domain-containing protein n=1 Tax=Clavelina lepadiformis TaxID=159417 RepID=A0ABP0GDC3_CLALP